MSHQSRILPLLGPAAVLYLVADLASLSGGLRWASTLMAVVAFAVTLAPLLVRSLGAAAGRRRVGYLGIATGLALLGWVMPQAEVMSVQIASAIGAVSAGGLVLDLATSVPDRIRGGRSFRPLFPLGALVAGLLGISAFLPPIEIADEILLVSSRLRFAPLIFSAACVLLATALRLARAPLGSGAEDRASNLWGILGLFPVAALVLAALALRVGGWQEPAPELLQTALATVTLFGVYGHVALVDARRRLHASRAARRALSALITVCLLGALAAWLRPPLPTNGGAWTITIVLVLLGAMLSYRVSAPLVRRVLSPYGGRLLLALDAATRALPGATTLEELGQAILPPIRKGSGALDAEPALFVAAPALEVRIDAAGVSHLRQRALP
ncbi:MAG: hypothetical protein OEY14_08820, partial [Myxococcales bacterium]|nr:hypothetical protein [Myxococcales bacterium]